MSQSDQLAQNSAPARHAWLRWFFAAAAGLFAFTAITWLMLTSAELNQLDRDWAHACKDHADGHESFALLMRRYLTNLGGTVCLVIVGTAGICLMLRNHRVLALTWLIAVAGGELLNLGVKTIIDRPRPEPELRDPGLHVYHDSFPSGHAMASTTGYGMWLYAAFLFISSRRKKLAFTVATIFLVGSIGFSRIYLRAHWFSDILGGYALGFAWLMLSIGFGRWLAERGTRRDNLP